MFKIKGKVSEVGGVQNISDTFKKREMILFVQNEAKPEFSDHIKFEAKQANCDKLNAIKAGDEVTVNFVLSGRKFEKEGKIMYITNLVILDLDIHTVTGKTIVAAAEIATVDDGDSLPF